MNGPFVKTWVLRETVESTSDLARHLVGDETIELPLVIRAARQTRGRGRGDHSWWSDAGSLTFTIAIDPRAHGLRVEHEPRLALASAVAVIEAISPTLDRGVAGIRWPNDIEVAGRKLGGILPERIETSRGARLAIGIGLNVATRLADAPPAIRRMAASLADLGAPPDLDSLLETILGRFATALGWLAGDDPSLPTRWAALDTLLGREVRVDLGPRVVSGVGAGIDRDGSLVLDTEVGPIRLLGGQVLRDNF